MFCSNCGCKVDDSARFCIQCGTMLQRNDNGTFHKDNVRNVYSLAMAEEIKKSIEGGGGYYFDEDTGVFQFGVTLSQIQRVDCFIRVYDTHYLVIVVLPLKVNVLDVVKRAEIIKFVCAVNFRIKIGSLLFDVEDGGIRFKHYVMFSEEQLPNDEAIGNSIYVPLKVCEMLFSSIVNILHHDVSSEDAVARFLEE